MSSRIDRKRFCGLKKHHSEFVSNTPHNWVPIKTKRGDPIICWWVCKLNPTVEWTWHHFQWVSTCDPVLQLHHFVIAHILLLELMTAACLFQSCLTWNMKWHHVHSQNGIKFMVLRLYCFLQNWVLKLDFLKVSFLGTKIWAEVNDLTQNAKHFTKRMVRGRGVILMESRWKGGGWKQWRSLQS